MGPQTVWAKHSTKYYPPTDLLVCLWGGGVGLFPNPDGHSGLLTFGVLIFGVGGSGFRMFGVSDVGGSVFFSDIRGFWCF